MLISEVINNTVIELDLTDLPKGIYFVKVLDANGNQVIEKLVKD